MRRWLLIRSSRRRPASSASRAAPSLSSAGRTRKITVDRSGCCGTSLKVEHSRTTSQVVEEALKAIDHVVACHVVSGDADFLVELAVPDLRTFEKVLTDQILAIGPVRDARSTFCVRTVIDRGPLPLNSWPAPGA